MDINILVHLFQKRKDTLDLALGILYTALCLIDVIQNRPVRKQPIKEEICKFQKAIHRNLKICGDLNIGKLGFEPPQFHLKLFDLLLCIVQLLILCKIHPKSAAHYVPCAPTLGVVEGFQNFVDRMQCGLSGIDGLQQLPLLDFQRCNAAFAFSNLLCGRVGGDFDSFDLFRKSRLIPPFAIGQLRQPIPNLFQVGISGRKIMESSIVFHTGCIGFLPFFVQLFIHLSDHLIEKCGKAVSFQPSIYYTEHMAVINGEMTPEETTIAENRGSSQAILDYLKDPQNVTEKTLGGWHFYESRIIGLGASIEALEKNGNAEWITPKYPPTTPTSEQKKATLDKTELEAYVAIVTGAQPIDYFDTFVSEWKRLGGDAIAQEVQEYFAQ